MPVCPHLVNVPFDTCAIIAPLDLQSRNVILTLVSQSLSNLNN